MRRRLKLAALAALALPALYLVPANLFLNVLGPRALSRGERFRLDWAVAWTLWPGTLEARGLELRGASRSVAWQVTADRAAGRVDLGALRGRRFRMPEVRGSGVRATVARRPPEERPAATPAPRPRGPRRRWSIALDRIELAQVREVELYGTRLAGAGTARGALRFVPGGEVRLDGATATFEGVDVTRGTRRLARGLRLDAAAQLAPYAPREHPGLAGLAFLSGSLRAAGEVPARGLPRAASAAAEGRPGRLAADLRVAAGELDAGSRLELSTRTAPGGPGIELVGSVGAVAPAALDVRLSARDLAAGGGEGRPPLVHFGRVEATATTPERRLHRLLAVTRELRAGRGAAALPATLPAQVAAETVTIHAPGSRATLEAVVDRVEARLDLAALVHRHIAVDGLRADGAAVRVALVGVDKAPAATDRAPWSLQLTDCRLDGLRDLRFGELELEGASTAEAALTYGRDGTFTVERFQVAMAGGRLLSAGKPVAGDLALALDASLEPVVLGSVPGRQLLGLVTGLATLRGTTPAVSFLQPYLDKVPWLGLDGGGGLDAELRLERGVLLPGSRAVVTATPARVRLFESRAEGRGALTMVVEGDGQAARTSLRVVLDRFAVAALRHPERAPYLRGRGLTLTAVIPVAVDLTGPVPDVDATLDLPGAEVPDLQVYDALLPRGAGVELLGGRGQLGLRLRASSRDRRANGTMSLRSQRARFRFQNVELDGRLAIEAAIVSRDLLTRRFALGGARFDLDGVSYRDLEGVQPPASGWWLHGTLASGTLDWAQPMKLVGEGTVDLQSSGPLLALFTDRSRVLRWFDDALRVENVRARGSLRLTGDTFAIDSLRATGGSLELRSRLRFSGASKRGHLYVRYGRLATAVDLLDGRRDFHLRKPLEWYEGAAAGW